MPKKINQPNALDQLLHEQTVSTRASLEQQRTAHPATPAASGDSPTAPLAAPPAPSTRRKTVINRKNARTIFFDDGAFEALNHVSYNNRLNSQRVVQTALDLFFERYYDAQQHTLRPEGLEQIAAYEQRIQL